MAIFPAKIYRKTFCHHSLLHSFPTTSPISFRAFLMLCIVFLFILVLAYRACQHRKRLHNQWRKASRNHGPWDGRGGQRIGVLMPFQSSFSHFFFPFLFYYFSFLSFWIHIIFLLCLAIFHFLLYYLWVYFALAVRHIGLNLNEKWDFSVPFILHLFYRCQIKEFDLNWTELWNYTHGMELGILNTLIKILWKYLTYS